jgi:hypothetical protein
MGMPALVARQVLVEHLMHIATGQAKKIGELRQMLDEVEADVAALQQSTVPIPGNGGHHRPPDWSGLADDVRKLEEDLREPRHRLAELQNGPQQ